MTQHMRGNRFLNRGFMGIFFYKTLNAFGGIFSAALSFKKVMFRKVSPIVLPKVFEQIKW